MFPKPRLTIDPTSRAIFKHAWVYGVRGPQKTEPPKAPNSPVLGTPTRGLTLAMRDRLKADRKHHKESLDDKQQNLKAALREHLRDNAFEQVDRARTLRLQKQWELTKQANRLLKRA